MIPRATASCIALVSLAGLLSACGTTAARVILTTPRPGPSAVPAMLVGYSSTIKSSLDGAVAQTDDLLPRLRHESGITLGNDCSAAAETYSNLYSTLTSVYTPSTAANTRSRAVAGFKLLLAATDECGLAADSQSPDEARVARADLIRGLKAVSSARDTITVWAGQPH